MKSRKILSVLFASLLIGGMTFFMSCEGPEGPMGPEGPAGADGAPGANGVAACGICHEMTTALYAKILQYEESGHALSTTFARNTGDCACCHTHEGFIDNLETGAWTSDAALEAPTPANCRTCHFIHTDYAYSDYDLRVSEAVTLLSGTTFDKGTGNMCVNCHQARVTTPLPVVGSADVYAITSYRYGPHHGPQSNLLIGDYAYEISMAGGLEYSNSAHRNVANGCATCHMATPYGNERGGHTFRVTSETGTLNSAGCLDCHTATEATTLVADFKAEFTLLHDSLGTLLLNAGIRTAGGYLAGDNGGNASTSNPANLTANELGAYYNWKYLEEDKSSGIHNPKYAKAMLDNSIRAMLP
jgi:hypothetical protein